MLVEYNMSYRREDRKSAVRYANSFNSKSSSTRYYNGANLYVKNFDNKVDDDRLFNEFSRFGTISSAKVMLDEKGHSRCFGFVNFTSKEAATKALKVMNGRLLGIKPLYVSIAERKSDRTAVKEYDSEDRISRMGQRLISPMLKTQLNGSTQTALDRANSRRSPQDGTSCSPKMEGSPRAQRSGMYSDRLMSTSTGHQPQGSAKQGNPRAQHSGMYSDQMMSPTGQEPQGSAKQRSPLVQRSEIRSDRSISPTGQETQGSEKQSSPLAKRSDINSNRSKSPTGQEPQGSEKQGSSLAKRSDINSNRSKSPTGQEPQGSEKQGSPLAKRSDINSNRSKSPTGQEPQGSEKQGSPLAKRSDINSNRSKSPTGQEPQESKKQGSPLAQHSGMHSDRSMSSSTDQQPLDLELESSPHAKRVDMFSVLSANPITSQQLLGLGLEISSHAQHPDERSAMSASPITCEQLLGIEPSPYYHRADILSAQSSRPSTGQQTFESEIQDCPLEDLTAFARRLSLTMYNPSVAMQHHHHIQGQESLTMASTAYQTQKEMLGERLYPLIQNMCMALAAKITGMLLEMENSDLFHILEHDHVLHAKVLEAVAVLQAHRAEQVSLIRPTEY